MVQSPYLAVFILMVFFTVAVDWSSSENSGNNAGCYYKGEYYTGNWTDGCEFNCSCIKPDAGFYKCTTRCPVYRDIPAGCVLSLPPGEECCKQPDCSVVTSNHNNNNDADNSDKNTTTTDNTADNVTETDGGQGCYYKGQYYHGNWTDGCEFSCTCKDTVSGLYRCTTRCTEHSDLNPGCELKLPPNEECCLEPVCNSSETQTTDDNTPVELPLQDASVTSATVTSTTAREKETTVVYETATVPEITETTYTVKSTQRLADIFSKFGPVNLFSARKAPVNNVTKNEMLHAPEHTKLRPGFVYNPTSTENKGSVKQRLAYGLGGVCSYKGLNYSQEERWFDGCSYVCTCMNAKFGVYKCIDRCPKYNALPVGCVNRPSRRDSCCFEPDCRYGSVIKQDKFNEPKWTPSQLQQIRSTDMSSLKQMFNKRMDLKSVRIGRRRYPELTDYFQLHRQRAPLHLNKPNTLVNKVVYVRKHQPPTFTRRFPISKKSDRYSDVVTNIQPEVVNSGKRFTDYSASNDVITSVRGSNDVMTSLTGSNDVIASVTGSNDVIKSVTESNDVMKSITGSNEAISSSASNPDEVKPNASVNGLVTTKLLNYSVIDSKSPNKGKVDANPMKSTDIVNSKDNTAGPATVIVHLANSEAVNDTMSSNAQLSNTVYSQEIETSAVKSNQVNEKFVLKQLMRILDITINDIQAVGDIQNIQMNYSTAPTTNRSNFQVSTDSPEYSVKQISGKDIPEWNHTNVVDIFINNSAVIKKDNSKARYATIKSKLDNVTNMENVSKSLNENTNNHKDNMTMNSTDSNNPLVTGKHGHVQNKIFMHLKTRNPNNVLSRLLKVKQEVGQLKATTPVASIKPAYRTMRTNTGMFQVSLVDGTITPFRKPIVGVLGKMLQSTQKRRTFQKDSAATQGECLYKGRFYTKGELWFDKCDFVCKCSGDGQYTCHQRCPRHEYIPSGCSMLKPNVQACCDILVCKNSQTENNELSHKPDDNVG